MPADCFKRIGGVAQGMRYFPGRNYVGGRNGGKFFSWHPAYALGWKWMHNAQVSTSKVLVPGLMASPLAGFIMENSNLQKCIKTHFNTFMTAVQEDFEEAGLGPLHTPHMSSVLVGSWVHHCCSSKTSREGLCCSCEEGMSVGSED